MARSLRRKELEAEAAARRAAADARLGGYTEGGLPKAYLTPRGQILLRTKTPGVDDVPVNG